MTILNRIRRKARPISSTIRKKLKQDMRRKRHEIESLGGVQSFIQNSVISRVKHAPISDEGD